VEALIMSAYRTSSAQLRGRLLTGCALAAAAVGSQAQAQTAFRANPNVVSGGASFQRGETGQLQNGGIRDTVTVSSRQTIIDWTPTPAATGDPLLVLGANDQLRFTPGFNFQGGTYTVLNRVLPGGATPPAILIDGLVKGEVGYGSTAVGGNIWFYSPGGILIGANSRFDIGSLVLTANNIDVTGGLFGNGSTAQTGTIRFAAAPDSRSFVTVETGAQINAVSSYVALIAPRVSQAGAITVNGSAALIAAESADVTIPVSGNLFEIAVFSGSNVNPGGETTLTHSGKTEITDPQQQFDSRRIYMIAVPKNDAITMLVSGTAGYEAASVVSASAGRVILEAGTGVQVSGDIVSSAPPVADTTVAMQGLTSTTSVAAGGTFVSLDATASSSSFGGSLGLNSGASSTIAVANGNSVTVGGGFGGSVLLGVAPSTVTVASGGSLKVANSLTLASNIGATIGSDMALTVDNGTVEVGDSIVVQSFAGGFGGPAGGSTGGATSLTVRNGGVVTANNSVNVSSTGSGAFGSTGANGTGGAATITIESGGSLSANTVTVESAGLGGSGGNGGSGQGGLASLAVTGGSLETGYGATVRSRGLGGSSSNFGGVAGNGKAGTASISVASGGIVTIGSSLSLEAVGDGASESGYGTGGSGTGGLATLALATGGIITADSLSVAVDGQGAFGQRGGGSGSGGAIDIDLTGASSLDANAISLSLIGSGGSSGSDGAKAGGSGTGGALTFDTAGSRLTFDQLTANAGASGGSSSSGDGGTAVGGSAKITFATTKLTGANLISAEATGTGGEGFDAIGGTGRGGEINLFVSQSTLVSGGDISLVAKGFGDFGSFGGGSGTGGKIALTASAGAKVQAANIGLDASGLGEDAFSNGAAGFGKGGSVAIASTGGAEIKGLNIVRADGRGGSGGNVADPGAGTGGAITIGANGGAIDSTGGTLRLLADGIGGRADNGEVTDALSRGGTIDIAVGAGGQLALLALEAQANGLFDDQPDGAVRNHQGTGVGGRVTLAVAGGTLTGDDVTLQASGQGAVSASAGVGGAGYQGRAEVSVSGGSATLGNLAVGARASGGEGIGQDSETGDAGGDGGTAGVGTNPYGGGAGAIVAVTGGSLSVSTLAVDGGSTGGRGGFGEEFADPPLTGKGGDAAGGVATFTTSGTGAISFGSLTVNSIGLGGEGGSVLLFDSAGSDAIGSAGGAGTGGLVSITLSGTGAIAPGVIVADASGLGGDGGSVRPFFSEGSLFGDGRGGRGGDGFGGGANVTINSAIEDLTFVAATSSATGGDGGEGPIGGSGGDAIAGSSTIAVAAGKVFYGGFQLFSAGTGGTGADGLGADAGSGGSGSGGNATLTIGADADLTTDVLQLDAHGFGGSGGRGGDNSSFGFTGGNGGAGSGGTAKITVTGGALTLFGGSETAPVDLSVSGIAGDGGRGGDASEGNGGTGGNGGDALGGTVAIRADNGGIDFFATEIEASALGGAGGQPGNGLDGVTGSLGFAEGGAATIASDQTGSQPKLAFLGFARIDANGETRGGEGSQTRAGSVKITAAGTDPIGALAFDGLEVRAIGLTPSLKAAHGVEFGGTGSPITSTGPVDIFAIGSIALGFAGDSGLRAASDIVLETASDILVSHSGQAAGGSFASIAGREVVLDAGGDISALPTTRIDATDQLTLVSGGSTALGSARVLQSLDIQAGGDATIGAGAQLVVDRRVTIRSGDDIVIDTGALLRAANNAPPETGYGATDPLQQQTQLKLYAGALFSGEGGTPADIRSLIIRGDVQSPGRTMQLEGNAVQAADGTTLSGGNLYVRRIGTTPGAPSDDLGQLTAPCLEGSVCLGSALFTGIVNVGGSGFAPTNLRISGDLSGTTVFAGATGTVRLGRDGGASVITIGDTLTIDARDGDLIGLGAVALTGGTGRTTLLAGGNIAAAGLNVTAPGGLDLASGGDVVLGKLDASAIRTLDQDLSVINPAGITASGQIVLAGLKASSNLFVDGATSVTIGTAQLGSANELIVQSQGDATIGQATAGKVSVTATSGKITADAVFATNGSALLRTGSGSLTLGSATATDIVSLLSDTGDISFGSLTATNVASVQTKGVVNGDAASAANVGLSGLDVTVSGPVASGKFLTISAGRDVTVSAGADLRTDGQFLITAGDDVRIGAGARLFAGGAGVAADQYDMAILLAQSNDPSPAGEVNALIVDAGAMIEGRGVQIIAEAVQAAPDSSIVAQNAFIGVLNPLALTVPGANEGGALSANCVRGNICLGAVTVAQRLEVGPTGFVPNRITLGGPVAADDLLLGSRDTLAISGNLTAGSKLTLRSSAGDVVLADGVVATATNGTVALVAARDILAGGASVVASGDIGLRAGRDAVFGTLTAAALRGADDSGINLSIAPLAGVRNLTIGQSLTVAGPLALSATGSIDIATAVAGGAVALSAQGDVIVDDVRSPALVTLSSSNGAVVAGSGGSAISFDAAARSVTLASTGSLSAVVKATAGDVLLTSTGPLSADGSATGKFEAMSGNTLSFDRIDAGGALALTALGDVTGGSAAAASIAVSTPGALAADGLVAKTGTLTVLADRGITLTTANAAAGASLSAKAGAILVAGLDASTLSASGQSVDVTGANGLRVSLAEATSGSIRLSAPGDIKADIVRATATASIISPGGTVTVADLQSAGAAASGTTVTLGSSADLIVTKAVSNSGDVVLTAAGNLLAEGLDVGFRTARLSAGGAIVATVASTDIAVVATGKSVSLTGLNGLRATANATGGDVTLATLSGTLGAAGTATGAFQATSAAGLTTGGITAGGPLSLTANGDISGGADLIGSSVSIRTPGRFDQILFVRSTSGPIAIAADNGIRAGGYISAGAIDLRANNGSISEGTNTVIGTAVTAIGKSVTLINTGSLNVERAEATAGPVNLGSRTGSLTVGTVKATNGITLTADAGALIVTDASSPIQTAIAKSISLASSTDLTVAVADATDGDMSLSAPSGKVSFQTLLASKSLTIAALKDVTGGSAKAGSVSIATPGALVADELFATAGTLTAIADGGITLATAGSAGTASLSAPSGAILVAALDAPDLIASGRSLDIAGASGLQISLAEATDGTVRLTASGDIDADVVRATGAATVTSSRGAVAIADLQSSGAVASGTSVALRSSGDLSVTSATASAGDVRLHAAGDLNAAAIDVPSGTAILSTGGAIVATGVSSSFAVNAVGETVSLTGLNGLEATVTATAGDVSLITTAGDARAEGSASGDFRTQSAAGIATGPITAGGALSLSAKADITGDAELVASSLSIQTPGRFENGRNLRATAGPIAITADRGIRGGSFMSVGAIDLRADEGTIAIDADQVTGTSVSLVGRAIALSTTDSLNIARAEATAGSVTLGSRAASLTVGIVKASDGIALTADSGALTVADAASPIQTAMAKSISLASSTDLSVAFASASDGDLSLSAPSGAVGFQSLSASKTLTIAAAKDVTGGSATAASIAISTPGALLADDLVATAGTLTAIADRGITLDTAVSTGTTTLKAAQGVVKVGSDIRPGDGLIVSAPSIDLTAQNGLNIAQAVATAGDLKLTTIAGDLIAGNSSAAGAIALDSAGALSFGSLTAQQGVTLKAASTVTGDAITSKAGAVSVSGTKGIALGSIAAAGPVTLGASAGTILVATDLAASGPIQATAQAIGLTAINDLIVEQAQATGGDIVLQSKNGSLTIGKASATAALSGTAANTLTVTGGASGATIAFTSSDLALGASAQVGSVSQTTQLTLTSTADRSFIGGTAGGTGYRLDGTELGRIAAQNITFAARPQGQAGAAFAFVQPGSASIVMESLNFAGAQLGSAGTLTIDSSRSIGVTGDVLFKGFTSGQRVLYRAGNEISLSAETGLVRVLDNAGGLAGTLELQAPQVTAMSVPARTEIPGLTLNQAEQRLGTNDQVNNDGGYFQAGRIVVKIDRLLFIQNSGGTTIDARRGFSANELAIEASGDGDAQVAINGRVGTAVGADLVGAIDLVGDFDPASSFSGCAIGATNCGGPRPEFTAIAISSARDQIEDEEDEDEKEEALQAAQTRPDPIIQFMTPPASRFDPLIDEPVTGAGNEDFWETPMVPSPGE
jgi:hypothetical protein